MLVILNNCKSWRSTEIKTANNVWDCEVGEIPYTMKKYGSKKGKAHTYRLIAVRIPNASKRKNSQNEFGNKSRMKELSKKKVLKELKRKHNDSKWREMGDYFYKFYITNDWESLPENVVTEYNKRGDSERKFSFMKNDFAWKLPPFMHMNENAVFFIAAALANNLFRGAVKILHELLPELRLNARLPDFIVTFINVACELIKKEMYRFYNTSIAYEKIM